MAVSEREKTMYRLAKRKRRARRVAKRVRGTEERPRLVIIKSHKHIRAQLIVDPPLGPCKIITGASTLSPEIKDSLKDKVKEDRAAEVGRLMAKRALEKGYKKVVFDRAGYRFHGVVKAFAQAAREGGLEF